MEKIIMTIEDGIGSTEELLKIIEEQANEAIETTICDNE
jgi:hypothetical protein